MREDGCVGVNFGADHGDASMLQRLGRTHTPADIEKATPGSVEDRIPGLEGGPEPEVPRSYLEPAVAPFCSSLLDDLIGDDRRFLFFDPAKADRNYNYNANQRLVDALRAGYRGAHGTFCGGLGAPDTSFSMAALGPPLRL